MALTFTLLLSNTNTTGPFESIVTASTTPTGPVLLSLYASSNAVVPTVSGCGLTWSLIKQQGNLFAWVGTGTPAAGAITINAPGAAWAWAGWKVHQVDGASAGVVVDTNIVSVSASSDGTNPVAVTYPNAFGAGSGGFAFIGEQSSSGPESVRTGWTKGTATSIPGYGSICGAWRADADTAFSLIESSAIAVTIIAVEIAPAGTPPTVAITEKTSIGPTITLPVGATLQLNETITDPDPEDTDLTASWASATPAAATVDSNGFVTAVAEGSSVVTASTVDHSEETGSDSVTIVVANAPSGGFDSAAFIFHALGGIY